MVGKEYLLPVPPNVLGKQLSQLIPFQRVNPSTVDKLCMLIGECFELSKKQRLGEGCFAVGNRFAETVVSRIGGRRPLPLLDDLGIIEVVRPHRSTICPSPTVRRFCHGSFKPYRLSLIGKAAREACNSGKRGKLSREADPVWNWVQQSLGRVSLTPNDQAEYQSRSEHAGNAAKFEQGERRQVWKGSYRWNCVCQMPGDLRGKLRFDSESAVTRLDISCSFGIMLPWLFDDEVKNLVKRQRIDTTDRARRQEECDRLREFLSDGDFYDKLASGATREEAKAAFQRFLNAGALDPFAQKIGRRFAESFPTIAAMISRRRTTRRKMRRNRRSDTKANVFRELQGRQNEVILAVVRKCQEHGVPSIPVWDELIVPFADRMRVVKWLHQELHARTGVRTKVGGIRMARAADEVTACPQDLCPHCWAKNIVTHLATPFPCSHLPAKRLDYP